MKACKLCGAAVLDEKLHRRWHGNDPDVLERSERAQADLAEQLEACNKASTTEIDRLRGALTDLKSRIVALHMHRPDPKYRDRPGTCTACSQIWPCATRLIVDSSPNSVIAHGSA